MITITPNEGLTFVFCKIYEKINRKSTAYIVYENGALYISNPYTCAVLYDQKLNGLREGNYQMLLSKSEKKTYMLIPEEDRTNQDLIKSHINEAKAVLKNIIIDDAHVVQTNNQEEYLAAGVNKYLDVVMSDSDTSIAKLLSKFKIAKYNRMPVAFSSEPIDYDNHSDLFIIFNMPLFNKEAEQIELDTHENS